MSNAFTPGPWKVDYGYPRGLPGGISRADAPRTSVTRFNTFARPTTAEAEANARLIAASPCLLEALTELAGASAKVWSDPFIRAAVDRANAAIAKATGSDQ